MNSRILVIVAHPDDEVLGCGATVARLVKEGNEVFVLILGEEATSRYEKQRQGKKNRDVEELRDQARQANRVLGVKKVFFAGFSDNRFDTLPLLTIVKAIEKIKDAVKPDIVFTHYYNDLNIDHKITYQAVITAARPLPSETVKEIYAFEVLSSTEWSYPLDFSPDTFYSIDSSFRYKLEAMKKYKSELRDFPHPRSLKGMELNARYWGMRTGLGYAEAFKTIRAIK